MPRRFRLASDRGQPGRCAVYDLKVGFEMRGRGVDEQRDQRFTGVLSAQSGQCTDIR